MSTFLTLVLKANIKKIFLCERVFNFWEHWQWRHFWKVKTWCFVFLLKIGNNCLAIKSIKRKYDSDFKWISGLCWFNRLSLKSTKKLVMNQFNINPFKVTFSKTKIASKNKLRNWNSHFNSTSKIRTKIIQKLD